jgi:hypothetical protein
MFRAPTQAVHRDLRQLFDAVCEWPLEGPHAIVVDGDPAPATHWARQDHTWSERLVEGPLVAANLAGDESWSRPGVGHHPKRPRVKVRLAPASDWSKCELLPRDAVALVQEPLHLWVENERNDFAFISWLAPPTLRAELLQLCRRASGISIHGGGSGELLKRLETLASGPDPLELRQRRAWRTVVLFDRDAADTDARDPSETAKRLATACANVHRQLKVPLAWTCLQRREIESYLPDEALPGDAGQVIKAWRADRHRESMAWAFDLKQGLLGDLVQAVTPERKRQLRDEGGTLLRSELRRPFTDLAEAELASLKRGFGKGCMSTPLQATVPSEWLTNIGAEYDRGPDGQLPRLRLIQALLDRS